jgi:hypothetical protein
MKTLRIKRAAAILMIAMMTTIAAEQASAMEQRPFPHPTRYPESGDFLGQWLGIEGGSLWQTTMRLIF